MKLDIKRNMLYFIFDNQAEEIFIFNTINFGIQIIEEQKSNAKKASKEMSKRIKKIFRKYESNTLLQRLNEKEYIADKEDILILFDNVFFIVDQLKKDKDNVKNEEMYNLIINVMKDIIEYIKEEEEKGPLSK